MLKFLTFIGSSLVQGNYDTYASDNYNDPNTASDLNQEGELFQDVLHNTSQRIPTLSGVAQNIARREGKILDKKQYVAYEIIAYSFLLCLIEDSE